MVTSQYFTIDPKEHIYYNNDPNEPRYNTKIQITAESEIVSEYGQEYKLD